MPDPIDAYGLVQRPDLRTLPAVAGNAGIDPAPLGPLVDVVTSRGNEKRTFPLRSERRLLDTLRIPSDRSYIQSNRCIRYRLNRDRHSRERARRIKERAP